MTQNLSSAMKVYQDLLATKFDKKNTQPMEPYDLRNPRVHLEGEVRFGKMDKSIFERVYSRLLSYGFVKTSESYQLKIICYTNDRIRCELKDIGVIRDFCTSNALPDQAEFILKDRPKDYKPYDNKEYGFRFSIAKECVLQAEDPKVLQVLQNWNQMDKSFRYMNRLTLTHPDMKGLVVDLSIVKSAMFKDQLVREKKFSSSQLFQQAETYEIEIELTDLPYVYKNSQPVFDQLQKVIRYITNGIQNTNYPIPFKEQQDVLREYLLYVNPTERPPTVITNRMFIGPSSYTLQNIHLIQEDNKAPCIFDDFCVTEKADGERKLLCVNKNGRIYMIDTNMKVQYTGSYTKEKKFFGSILDGEFIDTGHQQKKINTFAAFDIYFIYAKDYRKEPFYKWNEGEPVKKTRYKSLQSFIAGLNMSLQHETDISPFRLKMKTFFIPGPSLTMQECCSKLFQTIQSGLYEYETDGLIFTSMGLGVGMENPEDNVKNYKYTWGHSFKWKPPEFNTIDFLVEVQQKQGADDVHYFTSLQQKEVVPYKRLHLHVGYDSKKDGMIDPQNLLFKGEFAASTSSTYQKALFVPTSPYDPTAYQCYLPLREDSTGEQNMYTLNNEPIDTSTIVEFKYMTTGDKKFRWVPLRIRYDKTYDYRTNKNQFGNAYAVANSNWYSIHHPITQDFLTDPLKKLRFENLEDDSVYYNRTTDESYTRGLRYFHNLHVKKILLETVMFKGCTLIDYAVGKGGDISKWTNQQPSFVLGLDISKDNIHNKKDGACVRYIEKKRIKRSIFDALFLQADTSKLISTGEFLSDTDDVTRKVYSQVMAEEPKSKLYGAYVERVYGLGKDLFDVGSIQFALHYMFKNEQTLHAFMKNCADTIKVGGHFVGTCYDGAKIFHFLKDKPKDEPVAFYHVIEGQDAKKIWSITKNYDATEFKEDASSIGLAVKVYQETINKEFEEYLVQFPYFVECMKQYGFEVAAKLPGVDLPGVGNFKILYDYMLKHSDMVHIPAMSEKEKEISFFNQYFVFKKTRKVDSQLVYHGFVHDTEKALIGVPKKLKRTIVLMK
jgi:hypothetical protein